MSWKNRLLTTAILVVTLGAIASASTQIPALPQDHPIALVGGTLHPVSGPAISHGTILFDKGKIVAVGTSVDIPADAERIDVTGRHVYPGLIDAHTGVGLTEIGAIRATNDSREVGRVNPNVRAEVAVNPESEIVPVTRSNGVTLTLTVPGGGVISGMSALMYMDGWTWEDMVFEAPIGMHMSWPRMRTVTAWWMDQTEEEQIKQRDENLKALAQAFTDARAYQKARRAGNQPDAAQHGFDSRWEAMIPVLERTLPVIVSAGDIQEIQSAISFAEREELKLVILGGYDAPHCTDLIKRNDIPVIVSPIYRNPARRGDAYDEAFTVPARLHEAGVRFCIAGGGGASNVRNLPYHAGRAAAHGLPKDEALKSITLYPAQILGVADRVGSLEAGKDATVIVATGDILEITTNVELEFIQGRRIDLSDKQKILWEKYKEKYRREGADGE